MMAGCMMKKKKDVKQQGQFMGVMTRSKIQALQRLKKGRSESLQLGNRRLDKLSVASDEVRKRQRSGDSSNLSKGKITKSADGRKVKAEEPCDEEKVAVEKGEVEFKEALDDKKKWGEEEMVKDDFGGVDFVCGGVIDSIGGILPPLGGFTAELGDAGGVATNADGIGDSVIDADGDAVVAGGCDTAPGGGLALPAAKGGVDGTAANVDGDSVIASGGDDVIAGGGDTASGGVVATAEGSVGGTASISGGDGREGAELGGDVIIVDNDVFVTGDNDRYNFEFENEKPLFGRYEWEKVQP